MEKAYKNISYLFAAVLLFVMFAFNRTYFGLFPAFKGTTLLIHIHVATIMAWFIMLVVQPILIRTKNQDLHRMVGKLSYILVPIMLFFFVAVIYTEQTREKNIGVFAANLFDVPMFIIFYGLAIYYRKKVAYHIRYMVLTFVPFIDPASARIPPFPGLQVMIAFMLAMLIYERFNNKIYNPYLIGLAVFVVNLCVVAYMFLVNKTLLESLWSIFFK